MKVFFVVNTQKPNAPHVARVAAEILSGEGAQILTDESGAFLETGGCGVQRMAAAKAYESCDVVLSIGGDGTMLHAARSSMIHSKPLLGINIGRLGFLTSVESDELDKLRWLVQGHYKVEQRMVLRADVEDDDAPCLALNDVVLFKESPEKTISLDIYCDDILVSRFRGDGVIFATPTGSTAYSMSAGGPILDAQLDGIVVTQICAHIVHTPPLVFSSGRVLRAVPTGTSEERVCINCDGSVDRGVDIGQTVRITRSERTVPLVQFNDAEQLKSIDKKLKGR